jgi:hypothetical protein
VLQHCSFRVSSGPGGITEHEDSFRSRFLKNNFRIRLTKTDDLREGIDFEVRSKSFIDLFLRCFFEENDILEGWRDSLFEGDQFVERLSFYEHGCQLGLVDDKCEGVLAQAIEEWNDRKGASNAGQVNGNPLF